MTYQVGRCHLRELLLKNDMTQVELAEKLNVMPQQIQHYIQDNRVMSLKVAKNISAILNCTMDDLYEWIEDGF
ncbi:helix-turn-helix transcriptional regulator [Lysinibacillus pakistanensis]|uniref:Helix-turn-helix transcriptional regulator n=1 Tax=Lysinibacillus pakistanensis TaxID=759811 RepID=A0AAX3WVU6_9BACI|nr:helix-turn-helix transcriptional regulator [Lysinibacillus pakistanensis]MDM5231439.1 helix-turn-helix transcriptional regulator [Lysinibacillus pakistanensis]WHY46986.1 helix-turn-helix transcriptional regulator [Lysinibacillus pakistanensis]WHY51998.1 helix-turn-helix transcriptional regulator [Lysinibacillus pakistanensis]